ncbi:MAG TPA: glycosyltransferase family 2 protein [Nitrospira sp.]|nr:glycosyltransferase family 2 protein [Nitrospira sp.]
MVHVLIPAHNNKPEVIAVLACLERQRSVELEVLLVDDGSTDGTREEVRRLFPLVRILSGDGSLWWTGANVIGVAHILGTAQDRDFILLLNNDVSMEDDYVSRLVECSESLGRALVGSTIVDDQRRDRLMAGIRLDRRLRINQNSDRAAIEQSPHDVHVDVLPGRGTLVPVEVFRRIGTFNRRRLPHYGADYEFSIRAKRAGFRLAVSHDARVFAKLGITGFYPSDRPKISVRECVRLLCSKKSTANLRYYLNYVWMCSESGYRLRNTISHGVGLLLDTLGKTAVGVPLQICMRLWLRADRTVKAS